jgi:predicted dehydrogenase
MAAIAEKKHVFCEWPLALNSEQASKMLQSASRSGIGHAIGTQSRFSPGLMYMKQLVDAGTIGEPLMFNMTHHLGTMPAMPSHRWWLLRKEEGGGVTLVTTGHAIDIARWILGDVKAVCGKATTFVKEVQFKDKITELSENEFNKVSAFDSICFAIEMESGVLGIASTSIVCKGWGGFRFEIQGTEGRLVAETSDMIQFSNARISIASGKGGYRPTELKELTIPMEFTNVHTLSNTSMGFHIAQELRAFVNSIQNGDTDFSPGFKEGLGLHKIIEGIIRSSDTGSWEKV